MNGNRLASTGWFAYLYYSGDGGAAWTKRTKTDSKYWSSLLILRDGRIGAACAEFDYIYISTDWG